MWSLLRGLCRPPQPRDGLSLGQAVDPRDLVQQYRQGQGAVTATAVLQYYQNHGTGTMKPADETAAVAAAKTEAIRDLVDLSAASGLRGKEADPVKALLVKVQANQPITPADIQTFRDVSVKLGKRLITFSPAANMPATPDPTAPKPLSADLKAAIATGPNADRALAVNDELALLQKQPGGQRLTPAVVETLLRGVAEPRTADMRGRTGILGTAAALQAAKTLMAMPAADYKQMVSGDPSQPGILEKAATAAAPEEARALVLKALGNAYVPGAAVTNQDLLKNLDQFTQDIKGMGRAELLHKTTLLAIETGKDGLEQRFGYSCNVTVVQITRGEQDPVFALKLHKAASGDVIASLDTKDKIADQQKSLLETYGGKAVARELTDCYEGTYKPIDDFYGRMDTALKSRDTALNTGTPADRLKKQDLAALRGYLANPTAVPAPADLAKIQSAVADLNANGTPLTLAEVQGMRLTRRYISDPAYTPTPADLAKVQNQVAVFQASGVKTDMATLGQVRAAIAKDGAAVFEKHGGGTGVGEPLELLTHHHYKGISLTDESWGMKKEKVHSEISEKYDPNRNMPQEFVDQFAEALAAGKPVPFRIAYENRANYSANLADGHAMLMTDVRGTSPDRQFLVSDPWSGTAQWVLEADFKDGSFAAAPKYGFELGGGAPAWVTHLYVPE